MSTPIRKLNQTVRFIENAFFLRPTPDNSGNPIIGLVNVEAKRRKTSFRSENVLWIVAVDMAKKWGKRKLVVSKA